jgi:hypothetical protein
MNRNERSSFFMENFFPDRTENLGRERNFDLSGMLIRA